MGAGAGDEGVIPAGTEICEFVEAPPLCVDPPPDTTALSDAAGVAEAIFDPAEGSAPDVPVVVAVAELLTDRKDEIVMVDP